MAELRCAAQQEMKIIQHRLQFLLDSKGYAGVQAAEAVAQRTGMVAFPQPHPCLRRPMVATDALHVKGHC